MTALLAGATALDRLPAALRVHGWLEEAYAAQPNVVKQTMNGLVAFVVPGRDRYSLAQGTKTKTPGGIEAGATAALIRTLDHFLPSDPPLATTAATILNEVAANVAPSARRGKFASAFANLSSRAEGEGLPDSGRVPGRGGRLDPLPGRQPPRSGGVRQLLRGRQLRSATGRPAFRPFGWRLARYAGIAEGRPELKGYYQGRRAAEP